jgi:hypothetical protein
MSEFRVLKRLIICILLVTLSQAAMAQLRVQGTVYDRTQRFGMEGVSVMSTSGAGAATDSNGHYMIKVGLNDSISFSYQGKATVKFAVKELPRNRNFDMSLHVDVKTLPQVEVVSKRTGYKEDSANFRNEYRKIFDYSPQFLSSASGPNGVGVDIGLLFSIRKMKRMEAFRRFLEREEQDRYVGYRFNRALVEQITGLQSPALDTFMVRFRPSYDLLLSFENEYDYLKYIRDCGNMFSEIWIKQHSIRL